MSFKFCFLFGTVLFYLCTIAASAQAGKLFPPSNIGANPNIPCPSNQLLAWTGDAVACANPTPGVSVSCPAGTVLNALNGASPPTCVSVPSCSVNQQLNFNGTQFVCTPSTVPTCAAGQAITFNGTSFVCVNEDPAVPTCAAGQFLTYNGVGFQCSGTQPSITIPTCGANQYVTANGSQLICANLPTAGGGITGGCDIESSISNYSWKTETYAWGQGCKPMGTPMTVGADGYSVGQTASSICAAFEAPGYSCGSVTGPGYYWASCKCVKN